ncbi:MAG: PCMD domain-containing protein, partial [Rikenellaceae bacterium]
MKTVKIIIFVLLISIYGCVENDIPFPIIKAKITSLEISGETASEIDEVHREVRVTLSDTTNIKKALVKKFSVSEDTKVFEPKIAVGDHIDLSSRYRVKLTTYQDYDWHIIATQKINREVVFDGQVGVTMFDPDNLTAVAYISADEDITKVNISSIKLAPSNSTIYPNPHDVKDFSQPQPFTVTCHGETEEWHVYILPTEQAVATYAPKEIWARRVTLFGSAKVVEGTERGFEWKKADAAKWTKVDQNILKFNATEMTAALDFEPLTSYVYRTYFGNVYGEEKAFQTPAAPIIANLSMDAWSMNGKIWLPYGASDAPYWITGNAGVTLFKDSNTQPTTDAVAGKAAKLQTIDVPVVGLAAGNLFTGDFITDMGNPLNSTKWGRPFIGRPRRLAGMYKYTSKIIDVAKNRPEAINTPDKGVAWIKLEDWKGVIGLRPADAEELGYSMFYFD